MTYLNYQIQKIHTQRVDNSEELWSLFVKAKLMRDNAKIEEQKLIYESLNWKPQVEVGGDRIKDFLKKSQFCKLHGIQYLI